MDRYESVYSSSAFATVSKSTSLKTECVLFLSQLEGGFVLPAMFLRIHIHLYQGEVKIVDRN